MRRGVLLALALSTAFLPCAVAQAKAPKITSLAVTFTVQNVNRSQVPCATDGATYNILGHVTGPQSKLVGSSRKKRRSGRVATLYLHGLGLGEWFWNLRNQLQPGGEPSGPRPGTLIKGYDYATALAKLGHTSVTIDRLGYGASGHPDGRRSCLGGQADVAHQVVQALKSGSYAVIGGNPVRFKRVALAGHSIGGEIAMIEAYSFRDVAALIDVSFSAQNQPRAQVALGPTRDTCLAGGEPVFQTGPPGYAYYGSPPVSDFKAIMFHSAPRVVTDAAGVLRNRDPCGDTDSIVPALLQQRVQVAKITVPVLVICGTRDVLFSTLGCKIQSERFTRSSRVTFQTVRNAGHAIALEAPKATFRRKVARWLERLGF